MTCTSFLRSIPIFLVASIAAGLSVAHADAGLDAPARVDTSQPHAQPPYPSSAQDAGEQGIVVLDVYVWPNGKPMKVRISQSSGFKDLDTAAIQGVLNWHFVPAIQHGDMVSDWTSVKIVFQLPTAGQPAAH